MKLWDKGYDVHKEIEDFTVGNDPLLDSRLIQYDCLASIAHAKMLARIGIITAKEATALETKLKEVIELAQKGKFAISKAQEDCHTAIENYLVEQLGDLGKKIHTARSRNDQVLTALRLFYKDELAYCSQLANRFIKSLSEFKKNYGKVVLPGYTHTRKAMPSSIALWSQAFIDSMQDNGKILRVVNELVDQSPLGTVAGYGVPLDIDRNFTAGLLGFQKVQENPIYAQHSRGKFEMTLLHALSQIMFDLNKIASDLIQYSQPEFGYFELPEKFCTGSSIMPQKKNPDVLELLRAKYHVVASYEQQIRSLTGNLISGYHRDLQLTKEPTMQGLATTRDCLSVACLIFKKLRVNEAKCQESLTEDVHATAEVSEL
ncbi:MAG: argininosuccinate lyase, partial [bacterium]